MEREESAKKLNQVSETFTLQVEGSNYRIGIDWCKILYTVIINWNRNYILSVLFGGID